jgi:hypothetical protein
MSPVSGVLSTRTPYTSEYKPCPAYIYLFIDKTWETCIRGGGGGASIHPTFGVSNNIYLFATDRNSFVPVQIHISYKNGLILAYSNLN